MVKHLVKSCFEFQKAKHLQRSISRKKGRELNLDSPSRFLCFQMNAIGDAIMSQPAWTQLKSAFPNARIDLICRHHVASLFEEDPAIHAVFPFQVQRLRSWLFKDSSRLKGILDKGNYDFLIDFTALPLTAAVCGSESTAPSIGFQRWIDSPSGRINLGLAYDMVFPYSEKESIRGLMAQVVSPWTNVNNNERLSFLNISDSTTHKAHGILKEQKLKEGQFLVLHPGAKWLPKRWPISCWRKLISLLKENLPMPLVVLGSSEDEALINGILTESGNSHTKSILLTEIDLSSAIIKMASLCVCNDSAAMHIAAAVGTRSVSLFGPVSPERSAPSKKEGCHVFYENMFCSPCTLYYSRNRCRRGLNFCMYAIKPELVYQKIQEIISEKVL